MYVKRLLDPVVECLCTVLGRLQKKMVQCSHSHGKWMQLTSRDVFWYQNLTANNSFSWEEILKLKQKFIFLKKLWKFSHPAMFSMGSWLCFVTIHCWEFWFSFSSKLKIDPLFLWHVSKSNGRKQCERRALLNCVIKFCAKPWPYPYWIHGFLKSYFSYFSFLQGIQFKLQDKDHNEGKKKPTF